MEISPHKKAVNSVSVNKQPRQKIQQEAKISAVKIPAIKQHPPIVNLCKSLNLPADRLSSSIISFARFFSLPMDSKLFTKIRQEILNAAKAFTNNSHSLRETRDTNLPLSFAALAAASK